MMYEALDDRPHGKDSSNKIMATRQKCIERGVPEEKTLIIPNGVSDDFYMQEDKGKLRQKLSQELRVDLQDKKILLSVGRLIERKGFHWFVKNVIPELLRQKKDFVYLIVGAGIMRRKIEELINRNNFGNHILMFGKIKDARLKLFYNASHVFVMPNVPVKGDIEGFGTVLLEAASCGIPTVASDLEGIKDAVQDGENGILVESRDIKSFVDAIKVLMENSNMREALGEKAREFTLRNYSWGSVAQRYLAAFSSQCTKS